MALLMGPTRMAATVREKLTQISDLRSALQLIADCEGDSKGALQLASGVVRGMLTFDAGCITSARLTSGALFGLKAIQEMLRMPEAVFQLMPSSYSVSVREQEKIGVEIRALIENNFSFEGLII